MLRTASAQHQAGQLDVAEALYREVLETAPEDPNALHLLGVIAYQRGDAAAAVGLIARAAQRLTEVPDVHADLGNALRSAGRAGDAVESWRRAIALQPGSALYQAGLAQALNDATDHEAALEAGQRAIAVDPQLPVAHASVAAALAGLGRMPEAAKAFQQSLRLDPSQPAVLSRFATVLTELQQFDAAAICHGRAIALSPDDPHLHVAMARTLVFRLDMVAAEAAARKALALAPDSVDALLILGACLSSRGQFAEAATFLHRALALDPDNASAHRALAAIGLSDTSQDEAARLTTLLDRPDLPDEDRIAARFALAEHFDRAGQYDAAFRHVAEANRLLRATREAAGRRFDIDDFTHQVDEAIEHGTPRFFAITRAWGNPSQLPVLVVGMPRSGTTLVDRIMASHPQVVSAGELMDLNRIARLMMLENPGRPVEQWNAADARRHADAYVAKLQAVSSGASRVIDKMPDNIRVLGVATALLPQARVVLCRRDPRDICVSCHFQQFARGQDYSTDLTDCARRVLGVERLLTHWAANLPGPKLVVDYEGLVRDVEPQARRLIEFLDLPWDPACLEFHRPGDPVVTASFWQVRQPIFDRSVGRWRHYRQHLGPVFDILGPPAEPGA